MYITILNSRQSVHPVGGDLWLRNAERAVRSLLGGDSTLITSVGMNSWEFCLFLASRYNLKQLIVVPQSEGEKEAEIISRYITRFHLQDKEVSWRFIKRRKGLEGRHEFMKKRDQLVFRLAQRIIPVSIRPESSWLGHLETRAGSDKLKIIEDYKCEYIAAGKPVYHKIEDDIISTDIDREFSGFLIHWTRACRGPWPNEIDYDYYDSVLKSVSEYSHNALNTLVHIVSSGMLFASERHMRRGVQSVSFSSLPPSQAVKLMRYRARYREMSFEPYGIAIDRNWALARGIRQVIYGEPSAYKQLSVSSKPYFHSRGKLGSWTEEAEYRLIGDLDLSKIPHEKMKIICCYPDEIDRVKQFFDGQVNALYQKKTARNEPHDN